MATSSRDSPSAARPSPSIRPPISSPGAEYHVLIDSTAVIDTSGGNAFAGISSTTAWNFTTAVPTFASWISNPAFGLAVADQDLFDDPDGDGIDNGVENFFGTHPGTFTQGLAAGIKKRQYLHLHPPAGISRPPTSPRATAGPPISPPFTSAVRQAAEPRAVNFTTEANTPSPGFTRVTATATGTLPDRLFVDVKVTGP